MKLTQGRWLRTTITRREPSLSCAKVAFPCTRIDSAGWSGCFRSGKSIWAGVNTLPRTAHHSLIEKQHPSAQSRTSTGTLASYAKGEAYLHPDVPHTTSRRTGGCASIPHPLAFQRVHGFRELGPTYMIPLSSRGAGHNGRVGRQRWKGLCRDGLGVYREVNIIREQTIVSTYRSSAASAPCSFSPNFRRPPAAYKVSASLVSLM